MNNINSDIRFSIVPEWVLDAKISDRAVRVYSILARYADSETLQAFPSRETLARRANCHWRSIDRAIDELVKLGAITKTHRKNGDSYQSNLYTLRRVVTGVSGGTDTGDEGVVTRESPPTDTDGNLTITTELEPENYSERATQMPKDYKPNENFAERFPDLSIEDEFEAFCDYHLARGSKFKDWDRAFGTWCRNAVRFAKPKTVVHKQELKPAAEGPGHRDWVKQMHDIGEHFECRPGEFGCK